jgi:hypothetical protein
MQDNEFNRTAIRSTNRKEIQMSFKQAAWILSSMLLLGAFLTGCGPSPEELAATEMALTAAASTSTPTHTPIPPPTPTPTPTPEPDASAPIAWEDIGLPSGYLSFPPQRYGIGPGEIALELNDLEFEIQGAFVFSDDGHLKVYGYTFDLPSADHVATLDALLSDFSALWGGEPIPNMPSIGEKSAATTDDIGYGMRVDVLMFRINGIGAAVLIRHPSDVPAPVDLGQLASVYAESIRNPALRCELVSAIPVEGETWPTYEITAAGYYPGEGRLIMLSADFTINGEVQSASTALMGQNVGQSFDSAGALNMLVRFSEVSGDEVLLPSEVTIAVIGYNSGCVAEGVYSWP